MKSILVFMMAMMVVSFSLTPTFATHETQTYHRIENVPRGDIETSSQSNIHCASVSHDACGSYLLVDNDGYGFIKTYYRIGGLGVSCDMNIIIEQNGNEIANSNFYDIETFNQWEYMVMDYSSSGYTGDIIEQTVTFSNCVRP